MVGQSRQIYWEGLAGRQDVLDLKVLKVNGVAQLLDFAGELSGCHSWLVQTAQRREERNRTLSLKPSRSTTATGDESRQTDRQTNTHTHTDTQTDRQIHTERYTHTQSRTGVFVCSFFQTSNVNLCLLVDNLNIIVVLFFSLHIYCSFMFEMNKGDKVSINVINIYSFHCFTQLPLEATVSQTAFAL